MAHERDDEMQEMTGGFRDREKARVVPLKPRLFSTGAQPPGTYRNRLRYDFCLADGHSDENLHDSIRTSALRYFEERGINWHDGIEASRPSPHLLCSQSTCVNFLFGFMDHPDAVAQVLRELGYPVAEVLPFHLDGPSCGAVAFEWIGARNYLREKVVAGGGARSRGRNSTSADFAVRFKRYDGRIQIVLGEWKYTENYGAKSMQFSRSGTDRLAIYREALEAPYCQIALGGTTVAHEDLFFDPFDQLMRLQLLASAMEHEHEMDAAVVSVLHVAPRANDDLLDNVTSPKLEVLAKDVHSVWSRLVSQHERFRAYYVEDLLQIVTRHAPNGGWSKWMQLRYGGMR